VITAISVKPGFFPIIRAAYRKSFSKVPMTPRLAESPNQNHPAQLCKLRRTLRQNDFVIHQPAQNL
jgi:hypothetical protein